MGAETEIAWTDATFNPWWGCQRVSPGCTNCYAETWDRRWVPAGKEAHWGPTAERRFFGDKHWAEPLKWNRAAEAAGVRKRVFCASMADVFEDRRDLDSQRERLWALIAKTPWLDWQLLTKRPENLRAMLPWTTCPTDVCKASHADGVLCAEDECDNENGMRGKPWPNVWIGTTCEDQQRADERIPHLLATPAAVRFLSVEPQLGPVDLSEWMGPGYVASEGGQGAHDPLIDWVIVGGESGPGARPFHLEWARSIVAQCRAARVPVFVKQLGAAPVGGGWTVEIRNKKGGDMAEWPEDLRVREFPRSRP